MSMTRIDMRFLRMIVSFAARPRRLTALMVVLAAASASAQEAQVAKEERGYLGISLSCDYCSLKEDGEFAVWSFSAPPRITWVGERSPAARAGLKPGDVIVAVDGVSVTSQEGGRRFGMLKAGVPVEFTVKRGDREATVVVTPVTAADAFGEAYARVVQAEGLDSVRLHLKALSERQVELRLALKRAEEALARTEAEWRRTAGEVELQKARLQQRAQIDSMRRQLMEWHRRIRLYADSLAARTLYVKPQVAPQVGAVEVAQPGAVTIAIYSDAVAGARFEELGPGSPLLEYFPSVTEGLLITRVVAGTPAHAAGLRAGDVIVAVDGQAVRTVADFRRLLSGTDEAEVTYVRKGKTRTSKIPKGD
jgi:S1-C subfamily serine protease